MTKVGVWDIETGGLDHWGHDRNAFYRIGAVSTNAAPAVIYDHVPEYRQALDRCDVLIGHNTSLFDGPAVHGADAGHWMRERARRRSWVDTFWLAPLADPAPWSYVGRDGSPRVIADKPERMLPFYKLDNLAYRYGHAGKTDDLKELAKKHGGFDQIPKDDPEYRSYLLGDIEASRHVASVLAQHLTDYAWREMRIAAIAGSMHCNGFRLDADLATAVVSANNARNQVTLEGLSAKYGIELVDAKGRPRKKPLGTKEGKAALEAAFREMLGTKMKYVSTGYDGAPDHWAEVDVFDEVWPLTGPSKSHPEGQWAWGGDVIKQAMSEHGSPEAQELARQVAEIGGTRTVFQTALDNVRDDGFCHPQIHMLQRTGRSSVTDPGLTVFGKHNGRHLERAIFVPDVLPGEAYQPDTHVLFTVDLAQMDARCVAALSQDHAYLDLFEPGRDSHVEGAVMIWGPQSTWAGVDRRQMFKKLGHGWNYGMGLDKLAKEAGVARSVAEYFDRTMKERFPRLCEWKEEVRAFAREKGYVDNGFGRHVRIDPQRAHTQAPAGAGQGGTRDVLLEGALDLDDYDSMILDMLKAMIHDEFVWSVARRDAVEVRHEVTRVMSGEWCPPGCSRPVPVIAEASHFADRWSGCYEKVA